MKLLPAITAIFISLHADSQITTPVIRANFGVDADLRANFKDGVTTPNNDDWFPFPGGTGVHVIDTTGAAAIVTRYGTDMNFRRLPFYRTMNQKPFTVVNNNLWIDAVFIRDYHGDDSTVFASGANKNGDSPADWNCPAAQSIPDKNDILDMMVHIRRAGPSNTDSLWMFGGLSLDNTNGNRYIDFEMFQTDIFYDRSTLQFSGYGPDAGHTSWEFDAAGNVTKAGDIIFNAEYQSSSLSMIEARIWVNSAALSITPAAFDWNGSFDGATNGSAFGYASIRPKAAGAYYTGLASTNNTWGGPFGIVLRDESLATDYAANQYMEFSVNLSKLGLDGTAFLGGSSCTMPFRRILVKTRASNSFTSELKDFVGPFDFFLASRANVTTSTPLLCPSSVGKLEVTNPVNGSTYDWHAVSGNIITTPASGSEVWVDQAGTYVVTQRLGSGCSPYATDTVVVAPMSGCIALAGNELYSVKGVAQNRSAILQWAVRSNSLTDHFEIIRSNNGKDFYETGKVAASVTSSLTANYSFAEALPTHDAFVYYRVILVNKDGSRQISNIIPVADNSDKADAKILVYPNPSQVPQLQIRSAQASTAKILVYRMDGILIHTQSSIIQPGSTTIRLNVLAGKPSGTYLVTVQHGEETITRKVILQ